MQLDNNIRNKLLAMSDTELSKIVSSLASSAGVDARELSISKSDISALRKTISNATQSDVDEAVKMIGENKAAELLKKTMGRDNGDE